MKRLLMFAPALFAPCALLFAQTIIRVPQDQPTIQAGINAASNGDTVLVAEGTYLENIKINKKIVLGSLFLQDGDTSRISKTLIDGSQPGHPDSGSVVLFEAGSDSTSVLAGFTVRNGTGTRIYEPVGGTYWRAGGGIMIIEGGATIRNNRITANSISGSSCFGGGIANWGGGPAMIASNMIDHNSVTGSTSAEGGGISMGCNSYVSNNIIVKNWVSNGLGGAASFWGDQAASIILVNNTIAHNRALGGVEGVAAYLPIRLRMMNNIIWNSDDGGVDFFFDRQSSVLATNNLIRGSLPGEDILNLNPEFGDTVKWTLSPTSPCISAGRDSSTLNGILVSAPLADFFGLPRPRTTDSAPDLGAVESDNKNTSPATIWPQLSYHVIPFAGYDREYFVFLPRNYDSLETLSLLIALHGCNASGRSAMIFGFSDMADTMGFVVLYPTSLGSCWGDGFPGRTHNLDIDFIDALVDTMLAQHKVDSARIYITGYSSGGFLTYRLAGESRHRYRFAGIAPIAATIPDGLRPPAPPKPIPMIYFHGTGDASVLYSGTSDYLSVVQTIANWASYNHADTVAVESLVDVNTSDQSTVLRIVLEGQPGYANSASVHFYKVEGGGHIIPGPQGWLNPPINRDINGPEEIMRFFQHSDQATSAPAATTVIPGMFVLYQNYPNPFNPRTVISYQLSAFSKVSLRVYDLLGRIVATLVDEERPAGFYSVEWNAAVSSGVYFYRLEAVGKDGRSFEEMRKLLLIR